MRDILIISYEFSYSVYIIASNEHAKNDTFTYNVKIKLLFLHSDVLNLEE